MLRMLQPLFVLEQEGNTWFGEAQVPTSLMVFRARPPEEAVVPLLERKESDHVVRMVRVQREQNLADPNVFQKAAHDLDPALPSDDHPGLMASADAMVRAIQDQEQGFENSLWTIDVVPERSLVDALMREDSSAQRSRATGVSLHSLERDGYAGSSKSTAIDKTSSHVARLPHALEQALGVNRVPAGAFQLLADYSIETNQGLRTGAIHSSTYVR